MYEDTWETEDLIRDLAAGDRPDDRFITQHFSSLPAFTAQGLRQVLPQYLIYSLRHPASDVREYLIFQLAPEETESAYWRERLDAFSPAQRRSICQYVRLMQSELAGERYDEHLDRALKVWSCD